MTLRTRVGGIAGLAVMLVPVIGSQAGGAPAPTQPSEEAVNRVPVVRIPFPQDDGSLTPYTFERGYALMSLLYDTLLWRDADGTAQPWLATTETSGDGRQVTVRLVENARWHDGQRLTSNDVAFTFRYVQEHYHPRFTPQLRAVEDVAVVDELTVAITLRHPSLGFADQPLADLPVLPAHIWSALPEGAVAPGGLPVGSGPYRLVEHRPDGYRFEANDTHFRGPPAVATLEVPVIADASATVRALHQGEVDVIPASLPPSTAANFRDAVGVSVVDGSSFSGTQLLLNVRRPPFDRGEVRRALSRALDLSRIVAAIGDGLPAGTSYLHPASSWATEHPHQFDEAQARADLARLGVKAFEVLAPDSDPSRREAGRQVALALQRVGVQATVRVISGDELASAVGEDGSAPAFDAAIWPIPSLVSHDPDFLRTMFGSVPADSPLNFSGYASGAFDALADRIASAPDVQSRRALAAEAAVLLASDAPAIPLFFPTGAYAYRPGAFDGWVLTPGSGIFDKRSFAEPRPRTADPPQARAGDEGGGGGLPLRALALALLVVAAGIGVVIVRR